jgi:hypothetical protein
MLALWLGEFKLASRFGDLPIQPAPISNDPLASLTTPPISMTKVASFRLKSTCFPATQDVLDWLIYYPFGNRPEA